MSSIDVRVEKNSVAVVIPTYNRGALLLDTLKMLLDQDLPPREILVMDQTEYEVDSEIRIQLKELNDNTQVRWHQLAQPSIPAAMNAGLSLAQTDWVLFLDDDIRVNKTFITALTEVLNEKHHLAYVGQVVQPWQKANCPPSPRPSRRGLKRDLDFEFNSNEEAELENCMAGNLCVNREAAITAGGFDENFTGAAYRFETEFSQRFCSVHNSKILYSPDFLIDHLHANRGGTRSHEDFLTSSLPSHSVGDYYFALVRGLGFEKISYCLKRLFGSIFAKFYLTHPWYIPVRILAESRGVMVALRLKRNGQHLLRDTVATE